MAMDLNKKNSELVEPSLSENANDVEEKCVSAERLAMFSKAFFFSGRIRRLEFGLSYIIYMVLMFVVSLLADNTPEIGVLIIPLIWFMLAQNSKRFHDVGKSAWHILFYLIPLYNLFVLIMQIFEDGEPYENDYGKNPKGIDMYA